MRTVYSCITSDRMTLRLKNNVRLVAHRSVGQKSTRDTALFALRSVCCSGRNPAVFLRAGSEEEFASKLIWATGRIQFHSQLLEAACSSLPRGPKQAPSQA